MANAITGRGTVYDVRPTGEAPGFANMFGVCRDGVQGACAGLLGLLGATHMTGSPSGIAQLHSEIPWIDSIWSSLSADGLAGPVELVGAVALFFAARRTISRTIGLIAFIGVVAAYMNGYTAADMLTVVSDLLATLAQHLETTATATTA